MPTSPRRGDFFNDGTYVTVTFAAATSFFFSTWKLMVMPYFIWEKKIWSVSFIPEILKCMMDRSAVTLDYLAFDSRILPIQFTLLKSQLSYLNFGNHKKIFYLLPL